MTKYTRRMKHKGGAGAAPEVVARPFSKVDRVGPDCGHISDGVQNQSIMTAELMQDAIQALITRFTQMRIMDGTCVEYLSHLVCPLVWRVLRPERPDISGAWLNYGLPAGSGLLRWAPAADCIIDPDRLGELYLDAEWGRVVGILRGTPGFVDWLHAIVTGSPYDPADAKRFGSNPALMFPANAVAGGNEWENAGAAEWENAGAAGWENAGAAGWENAGPAGENQLAPIRAPLSPRSAQLAEFTPGTRAAILAYTPRTRAAVLGQGGKRSTRRKQLKNKRKTRR